MRSDLKVGIILGAVVVVAVIVMLAINGEKPPAPTNEDDNLIERHEGQSPTEQEPVKVRYWQGKTLTGLVAQRCWTLWFKRRTTT